MSATPPVLGSPTTGQSILSAALDTLKVVVGVANTPGGLAFITGLLGTTNPAVLLVEQFGIRVLGPLLATWTAPTLTEADVADHLSKVGYKVTPFDPMAAFKS